MFTLKHRVRLAEGLGQFPTDALRRLGAHLVSDRPVCLDGTFGTPDRGG